MRVWIVTDFPEPVAPAMRRCGIFAMLAWYDLPETPLPSATKAACQIPGTQRSRVVCHEADGGLGTVWDFDTRETFRNRCFNTDRMGREGEERSF